LFAVEVGALARVALGQGRRAFVISGIVAALVIGPTNLVGENLGNLLGLILALAAILTLSGGFNIPRAAASTALLVASGLVHWIFLPLYLAILCLAVLGDVLPAGKRSIAEGTRREATTVFVVAGISALLVVLAIVALLRAPLSTIEIAQDSARWWAKLAQDIKILAAPALAAVSLPVLLRRFPLGSSDEPQGTFVRRVLISWMAVMTAGLVVGVATRAVPAARFLALLVAVPGAVSLTALLIFLMDRVGRRFATREGVRGASVATLVGVMAVFVLAVPAAARWYTYDVFVGPLSLQQAEVANRYLNRVGEVEHLVVVVGWGESDEIVPVKERAIRVALSPALQEHVLVVPGTPRDVVLARATPAPTPLAERIGRSYWEAADPILDTDPPLLVLDALGHEEFTKALKMGARRIGQGVAALRVPDAGPFIEAQPPPHVQTGLLWGLLWACLILGGLLFVGGGWVLVLENRPLDAIRMLAMGPPAGMALLILAGTLIGRAGVGLRPTGTWLVAAIGVLGWGLARFRRRAGDRDGPIIGERQVP
jgi:hypothetical protein